MPKKTSSTQELESKPRSLVHDMGKSIRRARDDAGLTQAELAQKLGRRQASISEIENGKMEVGADTLVRLALILNKPVSYFFPEWLMNMLQPEKVSPGEAELLSLAKNLTKEELQSFIIQVRAIVERDQRKYYEWLEEDSEDHAS